MTAATVLADALPGVGLGHIARTSALAAALASRGFSVRGYAIGASEPIQRPLVTWQPVTGVEAIPRQPPDLLVLDSYRNGLDAVAAHLRPRVVMVFHDFGPLAAADLVLTTDPRLPGTRPHVVGGDELACLGTSYWGLPGRAEPPARLRRVLLTFGGGDPGGHAVAIAVAVRDALPAAEIQLVRGPQAAFAPPGGVTLLDRPASLLGALQAADLVVTAAGSSLLEALAVGTPSVALIVAENQRPKAERLAALGATVLVPPEDPQAVADAVLRLQAHPQRRAAQASLGRERVDGFGALRVAFRLEQLLR